MYIAGTGLVFMLLMCFVAIIHKSSEQNRAVAAHQETVTGSSGTHYLVEMINGHKYYRGMTQDQSPSHAGDCPIVGKCIICLADAIGE